MDPNEGRGPTPTRTATKQLRGFPVTAVCTRFRVSGLGFRVGLGYRAKIFPNQRLLLGLSGNRAYQIQSSLPSYAPIYSYESSYIYIIPLRVPISQTLNPTLPQTIMETLNASLADREPLTLNH